MDRKNSGVGVLDKAVKILAALEAGPQSLSELVSTTGIARPTAHRLAVALEHHRLVSRDFSGRFILGVRSSELAAAAGEDKLLAIAVPSLTALRDATSESAQLYRRQGDLRICVATAENENLNAYIVSVDRGQVTVEISAPAPLSPEVFVHLQIISRNSEDT